MTEPLQRQSSTESQSTDCIPSDAMIPLNTEKLPEKSTTSDVSDDANHSEDDNSEVDERTLEMMRALMLMSLLENEEQFEYSPEIECPSTTSNGLLSVRVINLDKLIENGKFNSALNPIFQIVYRYSWDKQNQFSIAKVVIANMNNSDNFQIKLPLRLFEYKFEFAVRAINVQNNEWLELSPFQTINVPSMLCDTSFQVGDKVLFRAEDSMHGQRAAVKELLSDNKYKLGYFRYDETKGSRNDEAAWVEHIHIVDKSHVFRLGVDQRQQINLTDIEEIEREILLQTDDKDNIAVFTTLKEIYRHECLCYCIDMYGVKDSIIYYRPMAQFISKNIYDYLFVDGNCFQYKVNCLINPYNDGKLVLNHLREYTIRRYYDGLVNGYDEIENTASEIVEHMSIGYQCDMCYGGINQFEYVFNCCHCDITARHDLCLSCVYTVIKLGTELEIYLRGLLKDQLNDDCVCEIVDYTVGRPICIH